MGQEKEDGSKSFDFRTTSALKVRMCGFGHLKQSTRDGFSVPVGATIAS
jgi:hypothetical protein